ncbi:MAG: hypothetical protein GC164_00935 [Phycisphaera sp.]|nr:hypothetical protein [Phycisphaera sp.]
MKTKTRRQTRGLGLHWSATLGCAAVLLAGTTLWAEPGTDKAQDMAGPKVKQGENAEGGRKFDGQRMHKDERGEAMHKLLESLNLSDDQKEQVRKIHADAVADRKAYTDQHKDEFESLRDELKKAIEAKDRDKVKEVRDKMKALWDAMPSKPMDVAAKIRAVLTPEQQAQFDAKLEELKKKLEERREEWKKNHDGKGPEAGKGDAMMDGPKRERKREGQKDQDKPASTGQLDI